MFFSEQLWEYNVCVVNYDFFFCWVWNFLEHYFNMIIEMKNKYN